MDAKQSPSVGEQIPKQPATPEQANGNLDTFAQLTPELGVEPVPGERMNAVNAAVQQAVNAAAATAVTTLPTADPVQSTATTSTDDDTDVIAREWVDKAKRIVAQTSGDPHQKSKQLSGLKREYIEKRYGKYIKALADESTAP